MHQTIALIVLVSGADEADEFTTAREIAANSEASLTALEQKFAAPVMQVLIRIWNPHFGVTGRYGPLTSQSITLAMPFIC